VGYRLGGSFDKNDSYRKNDMKKQYHLNTSFEFDLSPFDELKLSAMYMYQIKENFLYWKNLSNALIPPDDQLGDEIKSHRWHLSAGYRHVLDKDRFYTLKTIWFQNRFDDNIINEENPDGNHSISNFGDVEFQYNFSTSAHQWTAGVETNISTVSSNIFTDKSGLTAAAFVQDEIKLNDDLLVTPGLRLDYFDLEEVGTDYQLNPKIGIVYKPWSGSAWRGSAGRGFRAPSIAEVFTTTTASGIRIIPNLQLKPEYSVSGELGYNQFFAENIFLDVSIFYNRYWDLIEGTFTRDMEIQFQNVTNAAGFGFETNFNFTAFNENLIYRFGYTYAEVREITENQNGNKELGDYLTFRPRHLFYNQAAYTWNNFSFSADYRFISEWDRIDENLIFFIDDAEERGDAHILDLRLLYHFDLSNYPMKISLQVNNILQYHYVDLVGSIAPTREFVLTLAGKL
jgi:iron complex outermembrane receptor protein